MTAQAEDVVQALQSPNTMLLAALLAVLLLAVALLKLWLGGPKGNAVLIVGPCDAGKTTLFHQLRDGSAHHGTVASMQENVGEFVLNSEKGGSARPVRVVDVPGHPRVRGKFESYLDKAQGVVFMVDSVDFMPKKTETAEQLYDLLAHPTVARRRLPVLLACNKMDMGAKAHTVDFIRKRLEKEIDQMRSTRSALSDVSGGSGGHAPLGVPSEPFTFESHARAQGVLVGTASVSAVDRGGVEEVAAFIRKCVPA